MLKPGEKCALFHRTDEEVKAVRQAFGLNENSMRDGVDTIMEWLQKQPHLVHLDISRTFVETMILIAKGSIERTKEKLDNFYKYRLLLPEFFQNRQQILCGSNKVWDLYDIVTLPKLQDTRRIYIVKFGEEMSKFDIEEFFRRVALLVDLRMMYDYMAGDIWILDLDHVSWALILTLNPLVFKKIATFFTKAVNCRIYGIHVINLAGPAGIIQRIVDFFKQVITSVIMDRVIIHASLEDMYKYVPKECLPEDYGGKELSSQKLAEIAENYYREPKITEFLLECSKMVSNESLRPRDDTSEDFLSGSFRQLEVD